MFSHTKRFQYNAKPDAPDPVYAKQLQELIGGQWGEMSVTMGYLFQGWAESEEGKERAREELVGSFRRPCGCEGTTLRRSGRR